MWLSELAWPDVAERAAAGAILAVPLGSTEQHGPHLPLSTDTDIAVALCEHLASVRPDVLIAPAMRYGSSGEHAGFAGTLSIGNEAIRPVPRGCLGRRHPGSADAGRILRRQSRRRWPDPRPGRRTR